MLKYLLFPPHRFSRDEVGTHHRSLVRRASAARAILLASAASLYSSQQAVQAVPSQFVAKSGERDGSGASSRTPTLLIFDEKFAISSPSPNSPSKTRDCTGKSNGRLRVQKILPWYAGTYIKYGLHAYIPRVTHVNRVCSKYTYMDF